MKNNLADKLELVFGGEAEGVPTERKEKVAPVAPVTSVAPHGRFLESLREADFDETAGLEKRKYQQSALESIRENFLAGHTRGQLVLGTGGGKTTIALELVSRMKGRVLWLAPSNTALYRAVDELDKLKISKKFQVLNGKSIDPLTQLVFATTQMLVYGQKFRRFDPGDFSLVVSDEAHHSMGAATRGIFEHFNASQLYMTATPETTVNHLDSFAKPFFEYSSEDLIRNDGFPPWVLRRYEVPDEKIYQAKVFGDHYVMEDGEEVKLLNMPHRYAICLQILRDTVKKGEKALVFMPSVASSKLFIEQIAKREKGLKGKAAHVDGSMPKQDVRDMGNDFRSPDGNVLAVSCNNIWTESLDVPDIKHIILCDPCCSPRVLMQRIGRGARPAPGKTHLTIHDVVSVFENAEETAPSNRPLTVAGALGVRLYADGIVLNGPKKGKRIFEDGKGGKQKVRYIECTEAESSEIPFSERMLDLNFMADPDAAIALFKQFAKSFRTSLANLVNEQSGFSRRAEEIELAYISGKKTSVAFKEVLDAAKFFGTFGSVKEAAENDLDELCKNIRARVTAAMEKRDAVSDPALEKQNFTDPFAPARLAYIFTGDRLREYIWTDIFNEINRLRREGVKFDKLLVGSRLFGRSVNHGKKGERIFNLDSASSLSTMASGVNQIIGIARENSFEIDVAATREYWRNYPEKLPSFELIVSRTEKGDFIQDSAGFDPKAYPNHINQRTEFAANWVYLKNPELFNKLVKALLAGEKALLIPREESTFNLHVLQYIQQAVSGTTWDMEESKPGKYLVKIKKTSNGDLVIPIDHIKVRIIETAKKRATNK